MRWIILVLVITFSITCWCWAEEEIGSCDIPFSGADPVKIIGVTMDTTGGTTTSDTIQFLWWAPEDEADYGLHGRNCFSPIAGDVIYTGPGFFWAETDSDCGPVVRMEVSATCSNGEYYQRLVTSLNIGQSVNFSFEIDSTEPYGGVAYFNAIQIITTEGRDTLIKYNGDHLSIAGDGTNRLFLLKPLARTSGIISNEAVVGGGFKIWPNPTRQGQKASFVGQVFDITGRWVKEIYLNDPVGLRPGFYLIQDQGRTAKLFVIP